MANSIGNGPALLIDSKNTAYRAVFAGMSSDKFKASGYHPFVIWMRFARTWIEQFKPSSIHIFCDCPKESVWRRKIYAEYKDHRDTEHLRQVDGIIREMEEIILAIMPVMNTRVYKRDTQEADDLIYSACRQITPQKAIIISSDSDMRQIPWFMPNITCFEPRAKIMLETPLVNPAMQKALMGCDTDNVPGYRGIGEAKSRDLLLDRKTLAEFLEIRGDETYRKSLVLVDLSLNPFRLSNELYVQKVLAFEPEFDRSRITQIIIDHKIKGLNQEYVRSIVPFKLIGKHQES